MDSAPQPPGQGGDASVTVGSGTSSAGEGTEKSSAEPTLYVSPLSREEAQLVTGLREVTGLDAHVAARQLRYHHWELDKALAHFLDRGGAVSTAASGAFRQLQRLHPNRDARPRAGEDVVRVTAATPSAIEPDLERATAFVRAALDDASLDVVAGASQAARRLFSATLLAPYGSSRTLELRRGGAFIAAARVGTAAVAVHGGRIHDVFEIEAFAVASHERGRGYGQALLLALLLALAAAAPRPVVVVTRPRGETADFWRTTLLEWSRGSEGERGMWRALVAEDAVPFAYELSTTTALFWSETADRALRALSPWFARLAARKAEVSPGKRVAELEAALATVEAERERLTKRIRVLEAIAAPAASPVPPSESDDDADAAPCARASESDEDAPPLRASESDEDAPPVRAPSPDPVDRPSTAAALVFNYVPPVATWPARSPRPESDDDAGPAAAALCPAEEDAAAPSPPDADDTFAAPAPPPPPNVATAAPAPSQPDTADDEAIARLLAAEYAAPSHRAAPPPVRAAAKRAAPYARH